MSRLRRPGIMSAERYDGDMERHETPKLEAWLIDDEELARRRFPRFVGEEDTGVAFGKAADALSEFQKRISDGKPLPDAIFVDGNLLNDISDLIQGSTVVQRIREVDPAKQITVVAFSSDENLNKAMIDAGADFIMQKPLTKEYLAEALKRIREEKIPRT